MKNPKILIVTPTAYTLSGLATWLDYLLPGLEQKGWDVTLGLVRGPRYHRPENYLAVHPFTKTVIIHCQTGTRFGRVVAMRKILQKCVPDIVLTVNIPDALIAVSVERKLRGSNIRAVMSCHGIQQDLFVDMRKFRKFLDQVVCTNKLACRLAQEISGINGSRIHHVACGTAVPNQIPSKPDNEIFQIAFVGRIEQDQKRVHDLTKIAANLRKDEIEFRFLIAGTGPEIVVFQNKLKSENLLHYFNFLGFIDQENIEKKIYCKADALLVTSSWETGPIVIWEAMASGVPVVTSRYIGSGKERLLWHRKNCLMFDIGDACQAALQLKSLQSDSELSSAVRQNAFATAQSKLSHELSVLNWDRILTEGLDIDPISNDVLGMDITKESGRLNRALGPALGELLRKLSGRLPPDQGPGGEWPHTASGNLMNEDLFWDLARKLDARTGLLDEPILELSS